jgi:putative ABC transport system permease protein
LLSAYAPARRASSIPPVAAMREEFATPTATAARRRSMIGTVFLVVGAGVTALGAISSSAGSGAALMGLGLVLVGIGALLLSPLLSGLVIRPLGHVVGRPFGRIGALARTNAVRNPRRTAATAFALTLGLLIVTGISVLGSSIKASVNKVFDNNVTADYILTTSVQVPLPEPAAQQVTHVPGVASVTELHPLPAFIDGRTSFGTAVDGPLPGVLKVNYQQGSGQPTGTALLASKSTVDKYHWKLGSTYVVSVPGVGSQRVNLAGVYDDNQLLGPWLVSGQVYRALVPQQMWGDIVALVKAAPGANLEQLRHGIEKVTDPYYIVNVDNRSEFKGSVASQVNGLLGLVYGLLGLAIIIAILGIVNTLALSVVERRREIGMLRAVGMARKQVRRTIYLESLLIAVFGALLGLVLGIVYGSLFTKLLHSQGLNVLSIPWGQAVLFLVIAAVVGVLAALWPGIRAARTPPLAAIVET